LRAGLYSMTIEQRKLADATVFPIGLGGMPMSLSGRPPEERSIRTIQAAVDAGVNLIDTADAYSADDRDTGHNEELIARALEGRRDGVIIATKGGHVRTRDGGWEVDGSPQHLREACEASLKRLRTDRIDLYQYHRPDPDVPYAESIGALKELQDEGKIRWIGISNADTEQIEQAAGIVELVSVQNQLSLEFISPLEQGELALCDERGIAFLPWSPLGGIAKAGEAAGAHDPVAEAARNHGVSPQQVALAWLLSLSPVVISIPGASRPESILDSVKAAELELSADERAAIGRIAERVH
jgi:aryl-alcohol dehydrogenase-like predicted oxidoreductase